MTLIGHLLIWGTLGLIVYNYFRQKKKKDEMNQLYFLEYAKAKEELIETVERILGRGEAECVAEKTIWENMPISLLRYIKGNPHDSSESLSLGVRYETWFYGEIPYQYGGQTKYKYKLHVHIRNNIVIGWNKNP